MQRRARIVVGVAGAVLLLCAAVAAWIARTEQHRLARPVPSRLLLDRTGLPLAELPGERGALGHWPLPDALPSRLVQATLQAEDRRYHQHGGVELRSVARAVAQAVRARRAVSGASTIAMQVARMQRPERRTVLHKLREMVEAELLVATHGHDAVLRQYLLLAPYGHRVRGAARAARLYFDRPLADLSWAQAAFLAALPQMPGRMDPFDREGLQRGRRRMGRILRGLAARGLLTPVELQQALEGELNLAGRPRRSPESLHAILASAQEEARVGGGGGAGAGALGGAGEPSPSWQLQTTLDLELQQRAGRHLAAGVSALAGLGAGNGALLALDPRTGEVLVHLGSADWFSQDARGAIDFARARRSPGSALKPFLFALALAQGKATLATVLPDLPFEPGEGRQQVENMDHAFFGPVLARQALGNSRNLPALRLAGMVGVEPALRFFERAGVRGIDWSPGRYGLGIAIGNLLVSLEELAGAYAVLANGGRRVGITRLAAEADRERLAPRLADRLLPAEVAALVSHVLADPLARRPAFTPGGPLDFDGAVAVKTGTSQGHRDAWAVAYDERLVVAVWVGNHDWRTTDGLTGASAAAPIAHAVFEEIQSLRPQLRPVGERSAWPVPATVARRTVCALSGALARRDCPQRQEELFRAGSEPVEECTVHRRVRIDRRNGLRAGPGCDRRFVADWPMLDLPPEYGPWARAAHLEVAPTAESPLCPTHEPSPGPARVRILSPRSPARILLDPETPPALATLKLAARVTPAEEEIVWLVDDSPVARVGWPHEARWTLAAGRHVIRAVALRGGQSAPVTVTVE